MSWYRIYGDTGTTFDIWDYGHEVYQVPATQLQQELGLYDPDGKKKGYISGVIYDDISYVVGHDINPIPMPDGTKAEAKAVIIKQIFTESAQQQIIKYHRTAIGQPKLFMAVIVDEKNKIIYQIYTASRTEAEEIKNAYNTYGINNISFTDGHLRFPSLYPSLHKINKTTENKYVSFVIGWATVVLVAFIAASIVAITYFITSTYKERYHAKEVISYNEVEKKLIDEKIEDLKLHGKILEFKSLSGVDETETSYIYYYNDGTIVSVDKKTGEVKILHDSNMTDEEWEDFWNNYPDSNIIPTPPKPPSPYTEILKWIAVIAGIVGASLIIYEYISSNKHVSKAAS